MYIIDYSAVAEELAAETSNQGLGPAAKPVSRALLKIAGDGMRIIACGQAALLACKVMQQPQVAERVAQVVFVRPEMPAGNSRCVSTPQFSHVSTHLGPFPSASLAHFSRVQSGARRTWLKPGEKPNSTPALVFGGGEG